MKIIGVSGVARSGKDTLSEGLVGYCESLGLKAKRFALATSVKEDLESFCLEKLGISSFTENSGDKEIIRPLLVAYGCAQRKLSKGKYWTEKLHATILEHSELDVAIISDIRFSEYEEDEVFWLQEVMHGQLIHLTRYINEQAVLPPNETELINDPKVRQLANIQVSWDNLSEEERAEYVYELGSRLKTWLLQ